MVRLSFTCTSALFSTGVVSDSIYFILFSLSPFASQRMIKIAVNSTMEKKGVVRGSNSIYCVLNFSTCPIFFLPLAFVRAK